MSDVAELAGVSTMTVSRVLKGNIFVTDETRARVLQAVAKLKYHPNELARSLRDQRTRQIGLIVPNLHNPFFAMCAHAINLVAQEQAYSTIVTTSEELPEMEYVKAKHMLQRHIEGIILVPAFGKTQLLDPEFKHTPIVTMDSPVLGSSFDSVVVQNKIGARSGVRHLIEHHHRRIVFLAIKPGKWTIKQRSEGYRIAMEHAGLKAESRIVSGQLSEMVDIIESLVAGGGPAPAVFCCSNTVTRQALRAIAQLDLRMPEDIALIGFDDFEMSEIIKPGITVVRQPVDAMGRAAAELLFARINGQAKHRKPERIILPVELVVRRSCGSHNN